MRQRRWTRLRRRFKVTLGSAAAFTFDVCGGGFGAQLLRALSGGTMVEGTILADGKVHAYSGRVAWAKAGDVRLGIPGRMGVGFTNIDPTFIALLRGRAVGDPTAPRSLAAPSRRGMPPPAVLPLRAWTSTSTPPRTAAAPTPPSGAAMPGATSSRSG